MKEGVCPKCQSTEVYSGAKIKLKTGAYGCNTIPLGGALRGHVALDNYVCIQCGYLESYIGSKDALEKIRGLWEKI